MEIIVCLDAREGVPEMFVGRVAERLKAIIKQVEVVALDLDAIDRLHKRITEPK